MVLTTLSSPHPISTVENNLFSLTPPQDTPALKIWLAHWVERIIAGERIDKETAIALSQIEGQENILALCEAADGIRHACCGNVVDLCSIINVKSGNCSENCGYCSQSSHHQSPDAPVYGLKTSEEILAQAKAAAKQTQNLSNLKNLGTATLIYMSDSDDFFPLVQREEPTSTAFFGLAPWQVACQPYIKSLGIFQHPLGPNVPANDAALAAWRYATMYGSMARANGQGLNFYEASTSVGSFARRVCGTLHADTMASWVEDVTLR